MAQKRPTTQGHTSSRRVILPSRRWVLTFLLLSLAALAAGIYALITPVSPGQDPRGALAHRLTAFVGTPCFLVITALLVRLWCDRSPVLIVDDRGITTRWAGLVPWSEVAAVIPGHPRRGTHLLIYVRDVERLATRCTPAQARHIRRNTAWEGYATFVPQTLLPMKTVELLAEIGPYCHQRIAEHGPVGRINAPG